MSSKMFTIIHKCVLTFSSSSMTSRLEIQPQSQLETKSAGYGNGFMRYKLCLIASSDRKGLERSWCLSLTLNSLGLVCCRLSIASIFQCC